MRTIKLKPVDADKNILLRLEGRGLIKTFRPSGNILRRTSKDGLVDVVYSSPAEYGGHKIICVRSDDAGRVMPNSHPDNEEFLILNNTAFKLKPLLMIIGLRKHDDMERRAKAGTLSARDFIMLRFKYNDHETSIFTMLKDTPHCEMSAPGKGRPAIFFVSEPANLPMRDLDTADYLINF